MSDDTVNVFGRSTLTKVDKFAWKMVDEPGEFMMIDKSELHIDHAYQRDVVSNTRILAIAQAWSWKACGTLIVVYRKDGTFWIIDGQHRWLAAHKRSDIIKLPCMVYEASDKAEEAKGFIAANTVRGPVSSYFKFRADLEAGDQIAVAVQKFVESTGYSITKGPGSRTVSCVASLKSCWEKDEKRSESVWFLASGLCAGNHVQRELFEGMFYLELHLVKNHAGSLRDEKNESKLKREGTEEILARIRRAVNYYEKSGPKVWAQGILDLLNHGRRDDNRIPSLFGSGRSDG